MSESKFVDESAFEGKHEGGGEEEEHGVGFWASHVLLKVAKGTDQGALGGLLGRYDGRLGIVILLQLSEQKRLPLFLRNAFVIE